VRHLRIILEEINLDKNTCHRAERAIPMTLLCHSLEADSLLATAINDLEKTLEKEIKSDKTSSERLGGTPGEGQ
jgi:hypothetical protein